MNGERRRRALRLAALALPLATGCGQKIQQEYDLLVISPPGEYFAGAATAVLNVAGREVSRTAVSEGVPFSVTGSGVDVNGTNSGAIALSIVDGTGKVIGYGETPTVELELVPIQFRLFIQRPGTFGVSPASVTTPARTDMVAVSAPAAPDVGLTGATVTVPVIGLGLIKTGDNAAETLSDSIYFYNPLAHSLDSADPAGSPNGMRQYRRDAAGLVSKDGNIYFFGGLASTDPMSAKPTATSQLDTLRAIRSGFLSFRQATIDSKASTLPEVARSSSVLAESDTIYAFGGQAGANELDTVVALHPAAGDPNAIFELLNIRMGAPRVGHTATPVNFGADILLFGGDQSGPAVAELLAPVGGKPAFIRPTGDTGVVRWNHAAVPLSNNRVLLLGGQGPGGVLASSVLYDGHDRRFSAGAITLKTPRADFAAFTVGNDLVVAGGMGGDGKPVGDAEIYDASSDALPLRGTTPCQARYHAGVTMMSNQSVAVIGGTQLDSKGAPAPSSVVEIYQPTR
jgi:hypothetical protein